MVTEVSYLDCLTILSLVPLVVPLATSMEVFCTVEEWITVLHYKVAVST